MAQGPKGTPEVSRLLEQAAQFAERRRALFLELAATTASEGSSNRVLTADDWLRLLADVGREDAEFRGLLNRIAPHLGLPRGARERMLRYLRLRLGEVVLRQELAGVAGIDDWARRVRELRVEHGFRIASNETRDDLTPGEYVLEAVDPDLDLRDQWRTANFIRRSGGSAGSRLLALFRAGVGRVVTKEQLQYVAGIQEHSQRVQELAEAGWQIDSHLDAADLRPGEYRMTSPTQLDEKARQHVRRRNELLERAGHRCTLCGGDPRQDGVRLQVHRVVPVRRGGDNSEANLIVLCDACHADKHSVDRTAVSDGCASPSGRRSTPDGTGLRVLSRGLGRRPAGIAGKRHGGPDGSQATGPGVSPASAGRHPTPVIREWKAPGIDCDRQAPTYRSAPRRSPSTRAAPSGQTASSSWRGSATPVTPPSARPCSQR